MHNSVTILSATALNTKVIMMVIVLCVFYHNKKNTYDHQMQYTDFLDSKKLTVKSQAGKFECGLEIRK